MASSNISKETHELIDKSQLRKRIYKKTQLLTKEQLHRVLNFINALDIPSD